MRIYVNKTAKRIKFEINSGYYLKHLTTEVMKLIGSTKNKITMKKNGENVPQISELILVHCNFVNNCYQRNSRIFNTEFSHTEIWFADQNSRKKTTRIKIKSQNKHGFNY